MLDNISNDRSCQFKEVNSGLKLLTWFERHQIKSKSISYLFWINNVSIVRFSCDTVRYFFRGFSLGYLKNQNNTKIKILLSIICIPYHIGASDDVS